MIFGCVSANEAASLHSTCTKILLFYFSFFIYFSYLCSQKRDWFAVQAIKMGIRCESWTVPQL